MDRRDTGLSAEEAAMHVIRRQAGSQATGTG
jgi:hypothetical protein